MSGIYCTQDCSLSLISYSLIIENLQSEGSVMKRTVSLPVTVITLVLIITQGASSSSLHADSPVIENSIKYQHYSNVFDYNINTLEEKKKSAHAADFGVLLMFDIPQENPELSLRWGFLADVSYNQLYTKQAGLALSVEDVKKSAWSWRSGIGAIYYNDMMVHADRHGNEYLYTEFNYFRFFRIYIKANGLISKYSEYRDDVYGNEDALIEARIEGYFSEKRSSSDPLIDYSVEYSPSSVYAGYSCSSFDFSAGYVFLYRD